MVSQHTGSIILMKWAANKASGIAVFPTWLVIKSHEPIEHGKAEEQKLPRSDEEACESETSNEKTEQIVVSGEEVKA